MRQMRTSGSVRGAPGTGVPTAIAGYNYYGNPATFALIPHPEQGGYFIDDGKPGQMDPIADYGTLGFGMPGYVPSCSAGGNNGNNDNPLGPGSGAFSGNGDDNNRDNEAVAFLLSGTPDSLYVDPGADNSLQLQLTSGAPCTVTIDVRVQRTGAFVTTQTLSLPANTATLSNLVMFSRQQGLALIELSLTSGTTPFVLVQCPDSDTITFNGARVSLYDGNLDFYVPQGADSLYITFPTDSCDGQFSLGYGGTWVIQNGDSNDNYLPIDIPPLGAGRPWDLALGNFWPCSSGRLQVRFHFPGMPEAYPHDVTHWFTPAFSFSYGWDWGSPALIPAQLYGPQAFRGDDGTAYYLTQIQDPATTPYPYSTPTPPTAPSLAFTGPQWFTFYAWPNREDYTPTVEVKSSYGDTIGVESWTTDSGTRSMQRAIGSNAVTVPWNGSDVLHVRVTQAQRCFNLSTNVAGAVCGPSPAFSWANETDSPTYTPWSYFYVPDDRVNFGATLQVIATSTSALSGYTCREHPPAWLVIRDPSDTAVDSVEAEDGDRVTARVPVPAGAPGGLWSFRVRAPASDNPATPPEVQVALDDSLPQYCSWLDPQRFFIPVTVPGRTRMARMSDGSFSPQWQIGMPVAPYVCTAEIDNCDTENPPSTSEMACLLSMGTGNATKKTEADYLGLWGNVPNESWTNGFFDGPSPSFYLLSDPTLLTGHGTYRSPGSPGREIHPIELSAGTSHCDLKGPAPAQYDPTVCGESMYETQQRGFLTSYARQHLGAGMEGGYTATHAISYASGHGEWLNVRLDPPHDVNGVPNYDEVKLDVDTVMVADSTHAGALCGYETSNWILNGFDRDWMLEEAYWIRNRDPKHPIDLGEGPSNMKINRELEDIADLRGTWSYPRPQTQDCISNGTCRPLCDIINKWNDLTADRRSGRQGISLYDEAGFMATGGYVTVGPDSVAAQALASLMLGASTVREWRRFIEPDTDVPQRELRDYNPQLWAAFPTMTAMLDQVTAWLETTDNDQPNFGLGGATKTECGGPPIVYGDGEGVFLQHPFGVWFVVCNLAATGSSSVTLPWSQLHGLPPGDYSSTLVACWTCASSAPPTWTFSVDNGITCTLDATAWAVAFIPFPHSTSVADRESGGLSKLTVSPVPVTGTARLHFYCAATGPAEVVLTDVTGREVLREAIPTLAGWNDWIWNGELDRGRAAAGVYFLQLKNTGGGVTRKKVVICR